LIACGRDYSSMRGEHYALLLLLLLLLPPPPPLPLLYFPGSR
jgi:hypothetical protein